MTERYIVFNPDGLDCEFDGKIIVERHFTDQLGNVSIYHTNFNKYILRQTKWARPGIVVIDRTLIFGEKDELAKCLGLSREAKEIWKQLSVRTSNNIYENADQTKLRFIRISQVFSRTGRSPSHA